MYTYIDVCFASKADVNKYKKFKKRAEEEQDEAIRNECTIYLLKEIQKDIDEYRTGAIEEMKKHLGEEQHG